MPVYAYFTLPLYATSPCRHPLLTLDASALSQDLCLLDALMPARRPYAATRPRLMAA